MSTSENNKRLIKNTGFLYVRMLLVMGVTLFTSRIILDALGETNYGIYNVIGGVVAMFSFFSSTSASTCQRYFSYEIAKNNEKRLADMFKLNMTVFLCLALIVFLFAETLGLWFVNNKLNIPESRMIATNVVYQSAILSFFLTIITVPYNAMIISFERMSQFAYLSVIDVMLRLVLALILMYVGQDKLIVYAVMMLACQMLITFFYYNYCCKNFPAAKYSFYWNKAQFKEILLYSSWHQLGSLSFVVKNQGVNILLNMFFNPIVNAGRAIAMQVSSATDSLSINFFTAAKPQIYKYYAQHDYDNLHQLIYRSTKICLFLILILAIPLIVNCEYVLSLWLKEVPTYAVLFTQLSLINSILDSTNGPAIAAALATGKIKWFEIITGVIMLLNLPISYVVLNISHIPEYVIIVSISLSVITIIVRAFILKSLINLSLTNYLWNTIFPMFSITIIACSLYISLYQFIEINFINLILSSIVNLIVVTWLCYIIGTSKTEKSAISLFVKSKLFRI